MLKVIICLYGSFNWIWADSMSWYIRPCHHMQVSLSHCFLPVVLLWTDYLSFIFLKKATPKLGRCFEWFFCSWADVNDITVSSKSQIGNNMVTAGVSEEQGDETRCRLTFARLILGLFLMAWHIHCGQEERSCRENRLTWSFIGFSAGYSRSYVISNIFEKRSNHFKFLSNQNSTVRPAVRSDAGMAKEFPVSSGTQHRKKVRSWFSLTTTRFY